MLILGICGSLRREGWNRKLLAHAVAHLPDGWTYEDLPISELPLMNEDLEGSGWPEVVGRARDRVVAADGLLIATPEYNYSIPAPLKNAIDWISRPEAAAFGFHNAKGPEDFRNPFVGKKSAIIGATPGLSGTTRAQIAARTALQLPQASLMLAPEVFVSAAHEKIAADGTISDAPTAQALEQFMTAFVAHVAGGS